MIDLAHEIARSSAFGLIVLVLIAAAFRRAGIAGRGWSLLVLGFALLLISSALAMLIQSKSHLGFSLSAENLIDLEYARIVVVVAGASFLGIGFLLWIPTIANIERFGQLSTTLAKMNHRLSSVQEQLTSILRSSLSGVMVLQTMRDSTGNVVDFKCRVLNDAAEQILGQTAADLVGKSLLEKMPCLRSEGLFDLGVSALETRLPVKDKRYCAYRGSSRWYEFVAVKLGDGLAVTFADVSDQMRNEEQLRHAAQHDSLTGLPNRALLTDRLRQAISRAKRFPDYEFALLFLDFDRFKIINDSLGHEIGDQLLISIAERLRANLRAIDTASRLGEGHLPARLGGDEFVVLLDGIVGVHDAIHVADRLQRELSSPHVIAGQKVTSTASIGIVTSDGDYSQPDDIIRDADTAMYQAKLAGKARHVVFDERMHKEVVQRLNIEKELRDAVDRNAFSLVFEPIISLDTGYLAGFESLIRWPHPERGVIRPHEFIDLAEELNLIVPIGQWVLRDSCRRLRNWHKSHPWNSSVSISVNLSRQQLNDPSLIGTVRQVLDDSGIEPGLLRLEITESMVMNDMARISKTLSLLKELGILLAMDDFGTGHSSLSCLHELPIDILKIDRSFIENAKRKRNYAAIIHAVVELAHNLDLEVVAEGVETPDQLSLLQALECNFVQGHLFGQAVDAQAAEALLKKGYQFLTAA